MCSASYPILGFCGSDIPRFHLGWGNLAWEMFFNDGFKEQPIACDAGQIVEHFLALHKAKITARFETAMKDKRHGRDTAYTKDREQKSGRSLAS